jgi:DNA gyrase/topoisomerase IV subunit A
MSLEITLLIFAALAIFCLAWDHFDLKRELKQAEADIQVSDEQNDDLKDEINTYDKILNDTQTENGRLREELEQTRKQMAKFKGCPELGIAYKLQDVGTKLIEAKRYVSRWQAEACNFDLIEMEKDHVKRELVDRVKAMCSITVRDQGSNVEICGRLVVGMVEEDR